MIDQSHNIKPKILAMIQTTCNVAALYAKALCVDRAALAAAQRREDTVASEEVLRSAFFTDVNPLLQETRKQLGAPADPMRAFVESGYESRVAKERRARRATGPAGESSFA